MSVVAEQLVVQVSDTHFSDDAPGASENWEVLLDYIHGIEPDLVVHTGDVTLNGADSDDDLRLGLSMLDRLDVPWCVLPGNHDIGDAHYPKQPVDDGRRARYEAIYGDRVWSRDLGPWRLVGTDSQTLQAGGERAAAEWERLETEVGRDGPLAFFLHRPVAPPDPDEPEIEWRYMYDEPSERMLALLDRLDPDLVASGHVHQWRSLDFGGRRHVWTPSAWAMVPDFVQPDLGTKIVGLVVHRLLPDGSSTSDLVAPGGLQQLTMGEDFPSPYAG